MDDCATAYRWLLSQGIAPQNTVLAGDSVGGNLTLTTMMKLLDDVARCAAAARAAGAAVRLERYPRMWHVFQLFLALPQAVESLDDIARFLK